MRQKVHALKVDEQALEVDVVSRVQGSGFRVKVQAAAHLSEELEVDVV